MSTTAILAIGTTGTFGTVLIPVAVAAVASPINRARDARRYACETTHDDARTAELVSQIRAGAEYADFVGPDPDKLIATAYTAAAGLNIWFDREGRYEAAPLMRRVLDELRPLLVTARVPVSAVYTAPPLAAAVAMQLLLHQLYEACDGSMRVRVSIAAGAVAEAIHAIPDGVAISFDPLGEFDPEPLRRAQAEWVAIARQTSMQGWIRAVGV